MKYNTNKDKFLKKPNAGYLRSRYANWEGMLKIYNELRAETSRYAAVLEYTQDINNIKVLLGYLSEIWDIISYMQGENWETRVERLKKICWNMVHKNKGKIKPELRENVKKLKKYVYKASWHSNLGFDVEKAHKGSSVKKSITES